MRTTVGNIFGEAHGQNFRHYEWIAGAGATPYGVLELVEQALGVNLSAKPGEPIHGYLNTSRRPDGLLYVAVNLYNFECDGACGLDHPAFRRAVPTTPSLARMVAVVGEHLPL